MVNLPWVADGSAMPPGSGNTFNCIKMLMGTDRIYTVHVVKGKLDTF